VASSCRCIRYFARFVVVFITSSPSVCERRTSSLAGPGSNQILSNRSPATLYSHSVQFHATRDELIALVVAWLGARSLHVVAEEFPPARASAIAAEDVAEALRLPTIQRLIFTEAPPVYPRTA